MRYILIISFFLIFGAGQAQVTKMIQIRNQHFQMNGVQFDEPVEKKTNAFGLTVNNETGEIKGVVNLVELDLLNKGRESSADPEQDALKIRGFLPLNDILYNKQEQRTYKVELELIIKEFVVTSLFDFNIAYVKNSLTDFHDVIATTTLNLYDFKVKDTNGFESEVGLILTFQMLNQQR
jgi:hypothetical protein